MLHVFLPVDEHLTAEEQALAVAELENEMKTALLPPPVPAGFVAGGTIAVSVAPGHSSGSASSNANSSGSSGQTDGNVDVSMNINIGSTGSSSNNSSNRTGTYHQNTNASAPSDPGMQNLMELFPTVFSRQRTNSVPSSVPNSVSGNGEYVSNKVAEEAHLELQPDQRRFYGLNEAIANVNNSSSDNTNGTANVEGNYQSTLIIKNVV